MTIMCANKTFLKIISATYLHTDSDIHNRAHVNYFLSQTYFFLTRIYSSIHIGLQERIDEVKGIVS
jgi:hypothetical protein